MFSDAENDLPCIFFWCLPLPPYPRSDEVVNTRLSLAQVLRDPVFSAESTAPVGPLSQEALAAIADTLQKLSQDADMDVTLLAGGDPSRCRRRHLDDVGGGGTTNKGSKSSSVTPGGPEVVPNSEGAQDEEMGEAQNLCAARGPDNSATSDVVSTVESVQSGSRTEEQEESEEYQEKEEGAEKEDVRHVAEEIGSLSFEAEEVEQDAADDSQDRS